LDVEQPAERSGPRPLRPRGRLPRRRTDRVEDVAAVVLASVAIVMGLVAFWVGRAGQTAQMERAVAEAAERVPVRVVLLAPAEVLPAVDGVGTPIPVQVPARWTAPDGSERLGVVTVGFRSPAGTELPKWVDRRTGGIVAPPVPAAGAGWVGVLGGLGVALVGWLVLGCAWWGVLRWTGVRNDAAWAREWADIEPRWSGRAA
jgi:hypothetical protein